MRRDDVDIQRRDLTDPRAALEQALALAYQVDQLLTDAGANSPGNDAFRIRLARAHTLSLVDQLSELVGSRGSIAPSTPSGIRDCAPPPDDDGSNAEARRTWR